MQYEIRMWNWSSIKPDEKAAGSIWRCLRSWRKGKTGELAAQNAKLVLSQDREKQNAKKDEPSVQKEISICRNCRVNWHSLMELPYFHTTVLKTDWRWSTVLKPKRSDYCKFKIKRPRSDDYASNAGSTDETAPQWYGREQRTGRTGDGSRSTRLLPFLDLILKRMVRTGEYRRPPGSTGNRHSGLRYGQGWQSPCSEVCIINIELPTDTHSEGF